MKKILLIGAAVAILSLIGGCVITIEPITPYGTPYVQNYTGTGETSSGVQRILSIDNNLGPNIFQIRFLDSSDNFNILSDRLIPSNKYIEAGTTTVVEFKNVPAPVAPTLVDVMFTFSDYNLPCTGVDLSPSTGSNKTIMVELTANELGASIFYDGNVQIREVGPYRFIIKNTQ
ncbi:MAG: hypothetical protein JW969_08730 [Spirochaetales bacterium]|nr:hypothetical protein [Spirochaetales bacterium]